MKRLILLRHAKSSWRDSGLADHERPLSGRGERDAPRMGVRLQRHGAHPDLVITSHAERALRTATIVARALEYPRDRIRVLPKLYLAAPADILAVVAAQDPQVECLLLIGHNPGLTDLTNRLLPELALDNLPTAGVVAIDFDTDDWSDAVRTAGRLAFYDYPKNPRPAL